MAQLIWTEPALDDLDAVAGYIALDNPAAASRLVIKVLESIDRLATFPNSGKVPKELIDSPYREVVVSPCRVFYRFDGKTIFIVHAVREEQQFDRFLLDARMKRL